MMRAFLLFLCITFAFLLTGCAAFPVDLAVTVSHESQWGYNVCFLVPEAGIQMGEQRITGRVFGFVRGRDWWGASTEVVWPPVKGVS